MCASLVQPRIKVHEQRPVLVPRVIGREVVVPAKGEERRRVRGLQVEVAEGSVLPDLAQDAEVDLDAIPQVGVVGLRVIPDIGLVRERVQTPLPSKVRWIGHESKSRTGARCAPSGSAASETRG